MKEDDIFAEADIHFGAGKYNRAHVAAFANAIEAEGIKKGAVMSRSVYDDYARFLEDAANKHCRLCDGTGIFYGNVTVCPCTEETTNTLTLIRRLVKASQLHALFVGADAGHAAHIEACQLALDLYRAEFMSPGARYWWHAESDSLFTTGSDAECERLCVDQVDELTQAAFRGLLKAQLEKRVSGKSDKQLEIPEEDDEL